MYESKEPVVLMKAPGAEVDRHRHLMSAQRGNPVRRKPGTWS